MWEARRIKYGEVYLLLILTGFAGGYESHLQGPMFIVEPLSRVDFSNSTGGWADCSVHGSPPPVVEWLTADGSPVTDVAGVRRVLHNGTLVFPPFSASAYRQDIHSAVYRCVASNAIGRVMSRDVQVRAVVTQAYNVEAHAMPAIRGCSTLLRCVVPSFVKEFVRVLSWVQEPSIYIYPTLQGDGKFHLLPTGDLLVQNVEPNDSFPSYRCRTIHRLTRQVVVSSSASIFVNERRGSIPPTIVDHTSIVHATLDEGAVLMCAAQGCPLPDFRVCQAINHMQQLDISQLLTPT